MINLSIGNKIEASFSRVKYVDIAPKVGLSAERRGDDIPLFDMSKARLEDDLFWEILKELSSNTQQYGTRDYQVSEEARSRVISAV